MATPTKASMEAWGSLLVAHRRITDELDRELREAVELSLDEYDLLVQLRSADAPIRMTDLASRVLISRASTTRLVDRLVDRGWVERTQIAGDRRVVEVSLTPAGRAALRRAARVHLDGIVRRFESPLAGHDVGRLATSLAAVADAQL